MGRFDRATATSGFSMPAPGWRPSAEELEALLQLARSDAPRERQLAAKHLCTCHVQAGDERVGDAQLRLLEDHDPGVRRDALHSLTDSTPHDRVSTVVAALERHWNDPDPWLRAASARPSPTTGAPGP